MSFEVPFIRPLFPPAEDFARDYEDIVASGWFSNFGPVERRFAAEIEGYLGQGLHAVTVANATLGLIAAVDIVFGGGIPGRRVIMPSFTFAAGAQAIEWSGLSPLFVDIDPVTLQPSLEHASRLVEEHGDEIAGILFCNTFGIGDEAIDRWMDAAAGWDLPVVVDSAAGFGSAYADGSLLGSRGACEVFSFHATKPFAVGEGGAVVSRDPDLIDRVRAFENFGFAGSRRAEYRGMNAKMSEFNAALGLRQFTGFDDALASRRAVVEQYRVPLQGTGARIVPGTERSSVCFASIVVDDSSQLERARAALTRARVEFRDYYNPAVHTHPRFASSSTEALPETELTSARLLSLPVHASMSPGAVARVVDALAESAP